MIFKKTISIDHIFKKNVIHKIHNSENLNSKDTTIKNSNLISSNPENIINRILSFLTDLQLESKQKPITTLKKWMKKYKIHPHYGSCFKELQIIHKDKFNNYQLLYTQPTYELAYKIYRLFLDKTNEYSRNRKNKNIEFTSLLQQRNISQPLAYKESIQISSEPSNINNLDKIRINNLAAKFAKVGNFEMAEQLLNKIL